MDIAKRYIYKGILFIFLGACLFHFIYDLSGKNVAAALIAPINESVWEHMRLTVMPTILWYLPWYYIIGASHGIDQRKWFSAMVCTLVISIALQPAIFYFYTSALGFENVVLDISITFCSILIGQLLALHILKRGKGLPKSVSIAVILLITVVFAVTAFFTPKLPIFQDPVTGRFGL